MWWMALQLTTMPLHPPVRRVHTLGQSLLATTTSGGQNGPTAEANAPADGKLSPMGGGKTGLRPLKDRGFAMRIRRQFTVEGHSPYEGLAFRTATSEIRNPDGSIVFAQDGIEVPEGWSQVASDVLAQKYFRKAGVPKALKAIPEEGVPEFLWRKQAKDARETTGEQSAKQVFDRLAGTWTYWGWKGGYFDSESDARAF